MSLSPPGVSTKRLLARRLFDAFLAQVPVVGGPLTAIYSVTHPAKGEIELAEWNEAVAERIDDLEAAVSYLTGTITLSENAAALGKWLAEKSESGGRWDSVGYEEITEFFKDATKNEILEAVGELEIEGMISVTHAVGHPMHTARPLPRLFQVFDPVLEPSHNPFEDAALIGEMLLDSDSGISVVDIEKKYGWPPRRMNPALSTLGYLIDDRRKSSPTGIPYVYRSVFVTPDERARVRRFVETNRAEAMGSGEPN